jgi:hypothetical protein
MDIPLKVCYKWTEWIGSCVGNVCSVVMSQHHFTKYAVEPPFKICFGASVYTLNQENSSLGVVLKSHKISTVVTKTLYSLHT